MKNYLTLTISSFVFIFKINAFIPSKYFLDQSGVFEKVQYQSCQSFHQDKQNLVFYFNKYFILKDTIYKIDTYSSENIEALYYTKNPQYLANLKSYSNFVCKDDMYRVFNSKADEHEFFKLEQVTFYKPKGDDLIPNFLKDEKEIIAATCEVFDDIIKSSLDKRVFIKDTNSFYTMYANKGAPLYQYNPIVNTLGGEKVF